MDQESNMTSAWGKNTGAAVAAVSLRPAPHHAGQKKKMVDEQKRGRPLPAEEGRRGLEL